MRHCLIGCLLGIILGVTPLSAWKHKTIDYKRETGIYHAVVLDSMNYPHITYSDRRAGIIKYAYKDDSGWHWENVRTSEVSYMGSSALDDSGRLHIVYTGEESEDLYYAYLDGSSWHHSLVDTGRCGSRPSLAVDGNFDPHICYYYLSDTPPYYYIMYAHQDQSGWRYDSIQPGTAPCLALDTLDYPHIVFSDGWALRYGFKDGLGWHIDSVDTAGRVGLVSLALDSAAAPHISCVLMEEPRKLRYLYKNGTEWHIEDVDSLGRISANSLRLNSLNQPTVVYRTDEVLKRATFTGIWEIDQIDTTVRYKPSLQLSRFDQPHVSYDSGTYHHLMYAWIPDSEYVDIFVDPDSLDFIYGSCIAKVPVEDGINAGCFEDLDDPTWMEAVQLPIVMPCSLTGLYYYPCNPQNPALHWKVWEDDYGQPGNILVEGIEYPTASDEWISITIDPHIPLSLGTIYVGWSVHGPPYYYNGYDAGLEDSTNWWWNGVTWIRDTYIPGNLLIRGKLWVPEAHPTATMNIMNDGYQINLNVDSISYKASWIEFVSDTAFTLPYDSVQSVEIGVNAEGLSRGLWVDSLIIHSNDPNTPQYRVPIVFLVDTILTRIEEEIGMRFTPGDFALSLIRPNPMIETAFISYSIPRREKISLKIYNSLGGLVRTLVDEEKQQGVYTLVWDGKDNRGRRVTSGVYWSILKAAGTSKARKVILLR